VRFCETCGTELFRRPNQRASYFRAQRFCNRTCAGLAIRAAFAAAHFPSTPKKCATCAVELIRRPLETVGDFRDRAFCSKVCIRYPQRAARAMPAARSCKTCGLELTRKQGERISNFKQRLSCGPGCIQFPCRAVLVLPPEFAAPLHEKPEDFYIPEPNSGCWLFLGRISPNGYGLVTYRRAQWPAHRAIYTQVIGEIPPGLQLDHLCRNRACVNPDHLEPVTQYENWRRGRSSGAIAARTGQCQKGHAFTEENTAFRSKGNKRDCLTCQRSRKAPA